MEERLYTINVERRKEMWSCSICNATTDSTTNFYRELMTSNYAKQTNLKKCGKYLCIYIRTYERICFSLC